MKIIAFIILCGVMALAGLLFARTASSQEGTISISTVEEGTTATVGDSTITVPPSITVVEKDYCKALPGIQPYDEAIMIGNTPACTGRCPSTRVLYPKGSYTAKCVLTLSIFRERRLAKKQTANEIRVYKGRDRLHFRRSASEIPPLRRQRNLDYWQSRVETARAKPGRWFSSWAYYRIPSSVRSNFMCIHGYEGSWSDPNDPYWGGLQMDRGFMGTYGWQAIRKYGGFANIWPYKVQIIVANRARVGYGGFGPRGYGPWPNTARYCGLL